MKKSIRCSLCQYGQSPCDWCWNDPDGTLNFVPRVDAIDKMLLEHKRLQEDLARVTAERDAALNDLNGYCWACANGMPAKIGAGGLTTCDHMQKLNSLARGGRCKCDHWQWRGPRKEGDCNDE